MTSLTDYLDSIPPESILGQICWFTVSGAKVSPEDLKRWFQELSLDPQHIPALINPYNAFRSATTSVQHKYTTPQGHDAVLLVRSVTSTEQQAIRHIVREVKDAKGRKLHYEPKVGEAIFYRQGKSAQAHGPRVRFSINSSAVPDTGEQNEVRKLIEQVNNHYLESCQFYGSQALRAVVREYVLALGAVQVKPSGGVYFVQREHAEELHRLEELVSRLGGKSMLHTLPLLDSSKQRNMVNESYQDEVETEVRDLLADIQQMNQSAGSSGVPVKAFSKVRDRYTALKSRSDELAGILGLAQSRAESSLEMALDALTMTANILTPGEAT